MKKEGFDFENFKNKNKAEIYTGFGVFNTWTSLISMYRNAPKAKEILKANKEADESKKKSNFEIAKELFLTLGPSIGLAMLSTGCQLVSNRISANRIALLSAAYAFKDNALKELTDEVKRLGTQKERKIKDNIAEKHLKENKDDISKELKDEKETNSSYDEMIKCIDSFTGRKFYTTATKLDRAIIKLSHDILSSMWVSLNDLYYEIDLDRIPKGDSFGWNIDDICNGLLPISFSSMLLDDNTPCIVLEYDVNMRKNIYGDLYFH